MSEIKGQLLGILLVIAIFVLVGGGLLTAFGDAANEVNTGISEIFENPFPSTP